MVPDRFDVVRQAVQLPLPIPPLSPAQRETGEPLVVAQVAEHRFDGGEARFLRLLALVPQRVGFRFVLRLIGVSGVALPVAVVAHPGGDAALVQFGKLLLRVIARVAQIAVSVWRCGALASITGSSSCSEPVQCAWASTTIWCGASTVATPVWPWITPLAVAILAELLSVQLERRTVPLAPCQSSGNRRRGQATLGRRDDLLRYGKERTAPGKGYKVSHVSHASLSLLCPSQLGGARLPTETCG